MADLEHSPSLDGTMGATLCPLPFKLKAIIRPGAELENDKWFDRFLQAKLL